jgi:peptidyl-Lys metalloendopeptidase
MFNIESAGRKIQYIGPMIKRSAPSARDYIEIKPGASQLVKLEISSGYTLEDSGDYSLTYQPGSLSLINQGQESVVAAPPMATIAIEVGQKSE